VDANAGWSARRQLIPRLKQYDIEFVEQPLAADDIEGLRWLKQQNFGVPIFADESIKTSRDIACMPKPDA
jgi:L-alanine-DL-glutamate epimerase-like enolase superfamily enzyme